MNFQNLELASFVKYLKIDRKSFDLKKFHKMKLTLSCALLEAMFHLKVRGWEFFTKKLFTSPDLMLKASLSRVHLYLYLISRMRKQKCPLYDIQLRAKTIVITFLQFFST